MDKFIGSFNVIPSLPENIEKLRYIAKNIFWTWNVDAINLFRRMDRELWQKTNHNPVLMLGMIDQKRLEELAADDGFLSHMQRVSSNLEKYLSEARWYQKNYNDIDYKYLAYFSMEYGLTECLQIYSGGLGVLSGDHLKSASDLGLPLVGVGICYQEGYFQQYLNADGWQQERYEIIDYYNQPMELVLRKDGSPIKLELDFPGRKVYFVIWKIEVGRIPLYLLDTNISENSPEDQKITRGLYSGNVETRIQQEIILGIGGIRALHELGVKPFICHMNEGHSAFLALERIRLLMKTQNLSFNEAKDIGFYSNIFTTHTPVPAGIDVFPNELIEKYFGGYYRNELNISDKVFYRLGTIIKHKEPSNFNMAHLAMNMAGFVNGVSKLHGSVSKKMWVNGFEDIPFDEIPIDHVTNGIHIPSHLANEIYELYYRYLGDGFLNDPSNPEIWKSVEDIPDEELWRTHERRRERLVAFARRRLRKQLINRGASYNDIESSKEVLNAGALTIGFARRFATYKRATLIFKDIERLAAILLNKERPVQIIIAGKAHPKDDEGKKLIQEIVSLAKDEHLRKRIIFLENYDMNIARYLVEGCDIWLNNPRRPLEASGTSGMKVIANGGLNFSVLDGWWDEAYNYKVGWKIGNAEEYEDLDYQDEVECNLIYDTLENEIIPLFYERGDERLPRRWIGMMKESIKQLAPFFNTNRMVKEYANKFYFPAFNKRNMLMEGNWKKAKEFNAWKSKLIAAWPEVKILRVDNPDNGSEIKIGSTYKLKAEIHLGELVPEDVEVQIYYGSSESRYKPLDNNSVKMNCITKRSSGGKYKYEGEINCVKTGKFGFTLRILPAHDLLINKFELGLIKWASQKR